LAALTFLNSVTSPCARSARRFSAITRESLVKDQRRILAPQYVTRAGELATAMTKPAESGETSRRRPHTNY